MRQTTSKGVLVDTESRFDLAVWDLAQRIARVVAKGMASDNNAAAASLAVSDLFESARCYFDEDVLGEIVDVLLDAEYVA
jgi:hypothetical protein